ncbi:MAG TPA: AAA family ATPase [Allosphingosinicella sp.]|jgi:hypothetical protein|uniref:AAA family ATPase n=1 Tax=Allosphingosinicella sp. TaxID=2823234 RepID=UPI002F276C2D
MRLEAFRATALNHLATVDVAFDESLTFITGINGTGKTSVLNGIMALLTPSLSLLDDLSFSTIEVRFSVDGKSHTVKALKSSGSITLSVAGVSDPVSFAQYTPVDEDDFFDAQDTKSHYYQEISSENAGNRTLRFLNSIPTPVFLGIDRRYRGVSRKRRTRTRGSARGRLAFGTALINSLNQAIELAEGEFAETQASRGRLSRDFVRDLLLELIDVPLPSPSFGGFDAPSPGDRKQLSEAFNSIRRFPKVEGITANDVTTRVQPTLSKVNDAVKLIPEDFDISKIASNTPEDHRVIEALLIWNSFKPNLGRIAGLSRLVADYNKRVAGVETSISSYVNLLDKFLTDSGKSIGFNDRGILEIRISDRALVPEELSSGEAQIFVLLTHLSFNEAAQAAGVFIIDEPELSLHVQWQEILVSSLLKANPSIQYILATHSPSIILDNIENAKDLTKFARA